jgi:hypothetical protein
VLTKDELVCAGAFFHASRERFFGGGAWLTPAYVGDLLHQCFEGGAVIGLFDQLTLKELRENPAVPYELDEVTRVVEDGIAASQVARHAYQKVSCWTVAELRE